MARHMRKAGGQSDPVALTASSEANFRTLGRKDMRDDQPMRMALRWWDTLRPTERIVAMSLLAGGVVATANSALWAAATCYIVRQRARVAMTRQQAWRLSENADEVSQRLPGGAE